MQNSTKEISDPSQAVQWANPLDVCAVEQHSLEHPSDGDPRFEISAPDCDCVYCAVWEGI